MSKFSGFRKHPIRILFLSIAVLFFGAILRSGTRAASTPSPSPAPTGCMASTKQCWKVDITFSAGNPDTVSYNISPSPSKSKCNASAGPDVLQICAGDIVNWEIHTDIKTAHMVISQSDSILADIAVSGKPRLEADEGTQTSNPGVKANVQPGSYEYCVLAYDRYDGVKHVYVNDPKIIVGGNLYSSAKLANQIERDGKVLAKRAGAKQKEDADQALNKLLQALTDLKHQLHLQ